jgi:D-alanyl-D-alanine carboxypeptidase/D-alanyl-D-alanine-endopeptidase (penicillin-binding protein 4)
MRVARRQRRVEAREERLRVLRVRGGQELSDFVDDHGWRQGEGSPAAPLSRSAESEDRAARPIFGRLRTQAALVAAALVAAAPAGADTRTESALTRALRVPHVSLRHSAAFAIDLRSGRQVFAYNASLPLAPASNEKLAITFAALKLLGPSFRITTRVETAARQVGSTVRGDVYLVGGGDPTLSHWGLRRLALAVRHAGVRHIAGGIVGDESAFDTKRMAPGWKRSYYRDEAAPLSALSVDYGWWHGGRAEQPALVAAIRFRNILRQVGVSVARDARLGRAPGTATEIADHDSPPLSSIVRFMDQTSDNFTAETLLKLVSLIDRDPGSTSAGARVVTRALAQAGIPLRGVRIVDGSGLSSADRMTARALVGILCALHADTTLRPVVAKALPAAGRSGTLSDRLASLRGLVIAKTGTTDQASALSGFVRGRIAFSVLQNGDPVSYAWARIAQERFARVLARRVA